MLYNFNQSLQKFVPTAFVDGRKVARIVFNLNAPANAISLTNKKLISKSLNQIRSINKIHVYVRKAH